ncbi:MAG: NADH-quinone oxidoreductase subunit J [Verrucomicrobium sp.]|nr:NADH-quinone oxidoreductase subunit J [Verrucomicrobium sp.]
MPAVLFYIFAALTLVFGLLVVVLRNPVASALSLVMSFVGLAALFISLDAYFIGIIQILVYAGAVMVLFLFIIMLLDIKAEEIKKVNIASVVGGSALAIIFIVQLGMVLGDYEAGKKTIGDVPIHFEEAASKQKLPTIKNDLEQKSLPDTKLVGLALFQRYPFQIQLMGALLLVGTIGVVILSKREVN